MAAGWQFETMIRSVEAGVKPAATRGLPRRQTSGLTTSGATTQGSVIDGDNHVAIGLRRARAGRGVGGVSGRCKCCRMRAITAGA